LLTKKNIMKTGGPQFLWQTSEAGFTWHNDLKGTKLQAVGNSWRAYPPPTDLFLVFSAIGESDDQIRDFADKFGLLTRVDPKSGESRQLWKDQIRQVGRAVKLWETINERPTELKEIIHWASRSQIEYVGPQRISHSGRRFRDSATISSPLHRPELINRLKYGDVVMPARLYLQDVINEQLDDLIDYHLVWMEGFKRMNTLPLPRDLLGFLWLSLATAIRDSSTFRPCANCGKILVIAAEGSPGLRSLRRTCSDACRMAVSRRRTEAARSTRHPTKRAIHTTQRA
jgi:hypothetical protein